jgi:hypothetical protein
MGCRRVVFGHVTLDPLLAKLLLQISVLLKSILPIQDLKTFIGIEDVTMNKGGVCIPSRGGVMAY